MDLLQRIETRVADVAVIGLGYAGLPLALHVADAGFTVHGIDVDEEKVSQLSSGRSSSLDVTDADLRRILDSGRFHPTSSSAPLSKTDIVLICVPTPLNNEFPDMSFIQAAAKSVSEALHSEELVILESTTYPETTEDLLRNILEESGLRAGTDFFLGYSPERIDPGNGAFGITNVPKVVGGIDEASAALMEAFYGTFVSKTVRVSSPRAAEMTKLLENTYRHVNIALANEIAILCHDLGIDVWEVIDAAATKPFGYQPFYPGPGWGGHCIPVDPAYLSYRVRQMGETARFVELAHDINRRMPQYVVTRATDLLNERTKSLRESSILLLGVAYKPNVDDVRESPAVEIAGRLLRSGVNVSYNDPHVPEIDLGGSVLRSVPLDDERLRSADLVIVLTDHAAYDWPQIAGKPALILDTRNALKGLSGSIVRL